MEPSERLNWTNEVRRIVWRGRQVELVPVEYCASRFSVAVENTSIIAVLAPDLYQNDDPWGDSLLNCEQREEVSRLALERLSFERNRATPLPPQTEYAAHYRYLRYRLDCGREVSVEGCYISPSTLGWLEGSKEAIRDQIIEQLPERARRQFPSENCGFFIKPVPDGELPVYAFMVDLICYEPVSDPANDISSLVICWLDDDIHTGLPELIGKAIHAVEWDKYAVDGNI